MNASALFPILLLLGPPALAQGYGGLGSEAGGYAEVTPPAAFAFPRDHGPHPEFRIEWWYLTSNLSDAEGTEYGIQWTLFRIGLEPGGETDGESLGPGWDSRQFWMGHAGLTSAERHRHAELFARGGIGQAAVTLGPFEAWIDDWHLRGTGGPGDALADLTEHANGRDFAYDLRLTSDRPPVPQGDNGYSVKGAESQASYYYSQPFYEVEGTLTIAGDEIAVSGSGWLDREWSSQPLRDDQTGWDWFSLHLDSGARVMLYRLREEGGGSSQAGTWIHPDGRPEPLAETAFSMTPTGQASVAGRQVPVAWRLEIPAHGLAVDTTPLNAQSWMDTSFAYWEGPIRLSGSHGGRGYLEMTGYE